MVIFSQDDFKNPPAGTTSLLAANAGEIGATWTEHPHALYSGAFRYATNKLWADGGPALAFASGLPSTANYDVSGKLYFIDSTGLGAGVAARISTSLNTAYMVYYRSPTWFLSRYIDNSFTIIASVEVTPIAAFTLFDIMFKCQSSAKILIINGVTIISTADTGIGFSGRAGIRASGAQGSATGTQVYEFVADDYLRLMSRGNIDTIYSLQSSSISSTLNSGNIDTLYIAQKSSIDTELKSGNIDTLYIAQGASIYTTNSRGDIDTVTLVESFSVLTNKFVEYSDSTILGLVEDRTQMKATEVLDDFLVGESTFADPFAKMGLNDPITINLVESASISISMFLEDTLNLDYAEFVENIQGIQDLTANFVVSTTESSSISTSGGNQWGESNTLFLEESFSALFLMYLADSTITSMGEDFQSYFEVIFGDTTPFLVAESYGVIPYSSLSDEMYTTEDSSITSSATIPFSDTVTLAVVDSFSFFVVSSFGEFRTISVGETFARSELIDFRDDDVLTATTIINIVTETPPSLNQINENDMRNRSRFIDLISRTFVDNRLHTIRYRHNQITNENQLDVAWFVVEAPPILEGEPRELLALGNVQTNWQTGAIQGSITKDIYNVAYVNILLSFDIISPQP